MTDQRPTFPRAGDGYDPLVVDEFVAKLVERSHQEIEAASDRAARAVRELARTIEVSVIHEASIAALEAENRGLRGRSSGGESNAAALLQSRQLVAELETGMTALEEENDMVSTRNASLRSQIESLQADIARLSASESPLRDENHALRARNEAIDAEMRTIRDTVEELRRELDGKRRELAATAEELSGLVSLQAELDGVRKTLEDRDRRISDLMAAVAHPSVEQERQLEMLTADVTSLRAALAERDRRLQAVNADVQGLRQIVAERDRELADLRANPPAPVVTEAELADLLGEVEALRVALSEREQQLAERDEQLTAALAGAAAQAMSNGASEEEAPSSDALEVHELSVEERARKAEAAIRGRFLSSTKH